MLIVFFSSRISPFASAVIFLRQVALRDRRGHAAMLRTWLVRLVAMPFTLSVRSLHVPLTPCTFA